MFYYVYSPDKVRDVLKPLGIGATIVAVFLGYAQIEDPENLEFRYGLIVTVMMLLLLGSPLLQVRGILEKKDASSIPFSLTFMGTLVTFLWLLYGIILMNGFMILQNVIGFILCLVQLILILVYPAREGPNKKESVKKTD
uniref:Sugar transporter SWEET1 n=2 Tax=Anoplophora glabripennis TaxID=217634 RepID=V5GUB9_ANOGL